MSAPANDRPPPRFQFRLGTLLLAMVVVGTACAALAMPTPFWAGTLLCLTLASLLTSVLLVIYRTGPTRAFAVGLLVFTGGYLACVLFLDHSLRKLDNQAPMPTSRIAHWTFFATHAKNRRAVTVQVSNFRPVPTGNPGPTTSTAAPTITTRTIQTPVHNAEDFVEIVHSILSLLLGFLGGIFAWFLFVTHRNEDSRPENLTPGRKGAEEVVG
jgi:hypothetical protein